MTRLRSTSRDDLRTGESERRTTSPTASTLHSPRPVGVNVAVASPVLSMVPTELFRLTHWSALSTGPDAVPNPSVTSAVSSSVSPSRTIARYCWGADTLDADATQYDLRLGGESFWKDWNTTTDAWCVACYWIAHKTGATKEPSWNLPTCVRAVFQVSTGVPRRLHRRTDMRRNIPRSGHSTEPSFPVRVGNTPLFTLMQGFFASSSATFPSNSAIRCRITLTPSGPRSKRL
jgi:hypothetical protein